MAGMKDGREGGHAVRSNPGSNHPAGRDHAPASARGVRVTLAAVSAHAGLDPCLLEPEGDGNQIRIDGESARSYLRMLDAERAVLVSTAAEAHQVLLLPPLVGSFGDRGVQRREVVIDGWRVEVELESEVRALLRARARRNLGNGVRSGPTEVRAMIPGVVLAVSVVRGDTVTAGQQLVVVEAMKMQNELRAPRDGEIQRVAVVPGARIEVGDLLLVMT